MGCSPPVVDVEEIVGSPFVGGGFFRRRHSRRASNPYPVLFVVSPITVVPGSETIMSNWNILIFFMTKSNVMRANVTAPYYPKNSKQTQILIDILTSIKILRCCISSNRYFQPMLKPFLPNISSLNPLLCLSLGLTPFPFYLFWFHINTWQI